MSDETETTYFIQPVPRLNGEERQDDSNDESNTEDESSIDSTMDTKVKTKYFDDIMEKYTEPQEQIFQIHELKQQQTKMMEPHLSPTNYNTATTKNLEDEKEEDIIDEHTNPSESIVELIDEQSSVTTENAHVEYKCASEEHVGEDSYSDWLYTKFVSMDMDEFGPYISRECIDSRLKALAYWEHPCRTAIAAVLAIMTLLLVKWKSVAYAIGIVVTLIFIKMLYLRLKLAFHDEENRKVQIRNMAESAPRTLRILEQVDAIEEEAVTFLGEIHDALVGGNWRYIAKVFSLSFLLAIIATIFDGVSQAAIGLTALLTIPYVMKKRKQSSIMTKEESQLSEMDLPNC